MKNTLALTTIALTAIGVATRAIYKMKPAVKVDKHSIKLKAPKILLSGTVLLKQSL